MRSLRCESRGKAWILLSLLPLGCQRPPAKATIGYAFPNFGRPQVLVARDEIATTAKPGHPEITIVFDSLGRDEPSDIEMERAQRMVSFPNVVAVVGHGGSRGSLAGAVIYNEAEVPQIVPLGTSRQLRTAGPWTFMLAPDDSAEGAFLGDFLERLGSIRTITMFYVNDEYGTGLRDGIIASLERHRLRLLDLVPVNPGSDLPTMVDATLLHGRPHAIVCATRSVETGEIAALVHRAGLKIPIVAGDGALILPELADRAGPAADSLYVVGFWAADNPDPVSRAFVSRFQRIAHRDPVSSDAMEHDAIMLLVQAIREVGPDPRRIRDYLLSLGSTRPPYHGVTGNVTFQKTHPARLIMFRLQQGRPVRFSERDGR